MLLFKAVSQNNGNNYPITTGIYLHGVLEDKSGYDLVSIDKDDLPRADGIYNCVADIKGVEYTAKLFFWKTVFVHGLVVSTDDIESLEYAERVFEERPEII